MKSPSLLQGPVTMQGTWVFLWRKLSSTSLLPTLPSLPSLVVPSSPCLSSPFSSSDQKPSQNRSKSVSLVLPHQKKEALPQCSSKRVISSWILIIELFFQIQCQVVKKNITLSVCASKMLAWIHAHLAFSQPQSWLHQWCKPKLNRCPPQHITSNHVLVF